MTTSEPAVGIGEGTRIATPLSPLVAQHLHERMSQPDDLLFACLSKVNRAHVVMLDETGILPTTDTGTILGALAELDRVGFAGLSTDYRHGEVFTHVEQYVMEHAGPPGGNLHIGRSRGDLFVTTYRLYVRERLLEVARALVQLRSELHRLATAHVHTVMTSYTHGQAAQFVTLGHYLCGALGAFERDLERVLGTVDRVNRSTLGTGVGAGSSWPLDRERTAELLGFGRVNPSAFDSVYSQDHLVEAAACCTAIAANQLVLIIDLHTWSTDEFGYVELGDEFCVSSSLMPQKRNPMGFEIVRSVLSSVYGDQAEVLMTQKVDNVMERAIFGFMPVRRALDTTRAMLELTAAMIPSVRVDSSRMLEQARRSFAGGAELANVLSRECGIPFRQSHRVVGTLVRLAAERGLDPGEVTSELVNEAAEETLGRAVSVDAELLRSALDPESVLEGLRTVGGANPEETLRVLGAAGERLRADEADVEQLAGRVADADRALNERVVELVAATQ